MRALLLLTLVSSLARAETLVLVDDPATLAALEHARASFGERLGAAQGAANDDLARGPWGSIASVLEEETRKARAADPELGVGIAGHTHRLFDARWLRAKTARFDLIGVSNRLDRRPFLDGSCGETRLVYRLAYDVTKKGVRQASRLPMTVVLIYGVPDDGKGCREAAARWRAPDGLAGEKLAAWLLDEGPLDALPDAPRLVQVNVQLARWPSAARPDLGGHAEYLLRAFTPDGTRFAVARVDNTPDVARLKKDKKLRGELLAWLRANLAGIDEGTYVLPDKFLADRSLSVSPRGLSRRANRPFRQVFSPADVADLDLAGRTTIASPEALLRRLDDGTCAGCHQARTIAGFHLLGIDAPGALAANALAVPMSGHLVDELARRRALTDALARGEPVRFARPFSERSAAGGYGAHCGRGDPGFAAWTCDAGLACDAYDAPADDPAVGTCLPTLATFGDPCQVGAVETNANPHRDRIAKMSDRSCPVAAACNTSGVGFPGGMCAGGCGGLPPEAACGSIAVLTPFNDCLARGQPFETCLADNVRPAGLRACDAAHACRDDYICVRTGASLTSGACIPPYFLFQLRVDGHP